MWSNQGDYMEFAKTGQLCWKCQKACGGCSWSKSFIPIPGWTAQRHDVSMWPQGKEAESYRIYACPEFVKDPPRERKKEE